ncbi:hypothetical protein ZWY2020_001874 [Hordeum vulgare]|nr:hypothetical protein ZWY2020_001874 [Hordeum vulgare]
MDRTGANSAKKGPMHAIIDVQRVAWDALTPTRRLVGSTWTSGSEEGAARAPVAVPDSPWHSSPARPHAATRQRALCGTARAPRVCRARHPSRARRAGRCSESVHAGTGGHLPPAHVAAAVSVARCVLAATAPIVLVLEIGRRRSMHDGTQFFCGEQSRSTLHGQVWTARPIWEPRRKVILVWAEAAAPGVERAGLHIAFRPHPTPTRTQWPQ